MPPSSPVPSLLPVVVAASRGDAAPSVSSGRARSTVGAAGVFSPNSVGLRARRRESHAQPHAMRASLAARARGGGARPRRRGAAERGLPRPLRRGVHIFDGSVLPGWTSPVSLAYRCRDLRRRRRQGQSLHTQRFHQPLGLHAQTDISAHLRRQTLPC